MGTRATGNLLLRARIKQTAAIMAGVVSTAISLTPHPALADETSSALTEIVVTAQRREQSLQDVPAAVSAVSGDTLKEQGGASMIDLPRIVPGLTVRDSGPVLQFNLRGAATIDNVGYHEGVVAVYNDEVYRAASQGITGRLIDIDRVEVVRGPQGTLFGRNSTGGVVQFVSRKPTREFEAYADAGVGDYSKRTFEGAISGPLSETVSARAAVLYVKDEGWQKNDNVPPGVQPGQPGYPAGGRLNAIDSIGGRLSLSFTPSDVFDGLFSVTHQRERNIFQGYSAYGGVDPARYNPAVPNSTFNCPSRAQLYANGCLFVDTFGIATFNGSPVLPLGKQDWKHVGINLSPGEMPSDLDLYNGTARLSWKLSGSSTITSITGYEHVKKLQEDEFDGTAWWAFESRGGTVVKSLTQEFKLNTAFENKAALVAGLFFFDGRWKDNTSGAATVSFEQERKTRSYAVYSQFDYPLTDVLTASVGGRWTKDNKDIVTSSVDGATQLGRATDNSDFVTGRAGLEWRPRAGLLGYISAANSRKSGEFDTNDPTAPGKFRPERVNSFELGEKLEFLDGHARLNTSVYYSKTKDKQLSSVVITTGSTASANAFNIGDVVAKGVDLDFLVVPTEAFELGASVNYVHTQVQSSFSRRRTLEGPLYPLDGNRFLGTPEWQLGPHAKFTQSLGTIGRISYELDYKWQSKVFWDISNEPYSTEESYGLLGANVRWESENGRYYVRAYGTNLADKQYANLRFWVTGFPIAIVQWGQPRRIGGEFGVKF